ncbi:class I SAM-dependent methyltransferase [Bacillus alkalicellulosilyticus]|uniref:class I SAM-dependent methyltransferase n=1 Tax=Alkalihalobacterium alkalicellulosilyticum TaxID=1912214 RepID=UPI00099692E2|nr:class I SAM-dependent methyltransferase [Bacillus alkalicellulosilyticus]
MSSLYDSIGKTYDTTRKADPEITGRLRNHLQVSTGSKILDIACGTGNYTIALEKTGLCMTGSDVSGEMIKKAKRKSSTIDWGVADVNKLPYEDNFFEGVTCTLAIHHFKELLTPFREIFRVLHKGRFVIFTSSPEQMNKYWLKEYFPDAIKKSANQMPGLEEVRTSLKTVGFHIVGLETYLIQPNLQDFFLYSGKYDPKMYLNENVRSGISTFANVASKGEVEEGCKKLKKDIETNKIEDVLTNFSSDLGDYLFIVAEKK